MSNITIKPADGALCGEHYLYENDEILGMVFLSWRQGCWVFMPNAGSKLTHENLTEIGKQLRDFNIKN